MHNNTLHKHLRKISGLYDFFTLALELFDEFLGADPELLPETGAEILRVVEPYGISQVSDPHVALLFQQPVSRAQPYVDHKRGRSKPGQRFEFLGEDGTRRVHFPCEIGLRKFTVVDMRIDARHRPAHEIFVHRGIFQRFDLKDKLVAEMRTFALLLSELHL